MSSAGTDGVDAPSHGRLRARPGHAGDGVESRVRESDQTPGVHALRLGTQRDGLLLVPAHPAPGAELPLVVALHGAGGTGRQMIGVLDADARRRGLLVLAPDSRGVTWDVIGRGYGEDVAFLDQALAVVFATFPVDPARLAIAGFSDGASYALSLGLPNGDLFSHVVAWSPGFSARTTRTGAPRIFVSHGVGDDVLPIDRCSRRLVPVLRRSGYDVTYEEFADGHRVPADVLTASLDWLTA